MNHNLSNRKYYSSNKLFLNKLLFYIVVLDLMMFPYIRILSMSLSMIVVPFWLIANYREIIYDKEFWIIIIIIIIPIFISVGLSYYTTNYIVYLQNIKYSVILIYGLLFYMFFKHMISIYNFKIYSQLNLYIIFNFILALIYLNNASFYFIVRSFWSMSGNIIEVTDSLSIFRFTGIFSDPNNASSAYIAIMIFLIFRVKDRRQIYYIYTILCCSLLSLTTLSSTGIFILGIMLLTIIALKCMSIKKITIKYSTLLTIILMMFAFPIILYYIFNSNMIELAFKRASENSINYRFDIWKELLSSINIFNNVLWGMGGTIVSNGRIIYPHNGHLYLIYNYGFLAYIGFLMIFFIFRGKFNIKKSLFLLPLFVGFTVNVGIIDVRFMNMLSLLAAVYFNELKDDTPVSYHNKEKK